MPIMIENIKNQEIKGILKDYEDYGYMTGKEFENFKEYSHEIEDNYKFWNSTFESAMDWGIIPLVPQIMVTSMKTEVEQIEYLNKWKIYSGSITSCYYMNAVLRRLWNMECSGYNNNPFFDFQKLVKMVNAYWKIEEPYKAPNKIAWGWKFSMEKADLENGYYSKSWKLYMWGCIKNYLIKNGVDFTKEESLKVRKIVGLAEIYSTIE